MQRWIRDVLLGAVDFAFGYDFFISYKHADGPEYARSLASRLAAEGFRVFLDQRDYVPGDALTPATKRRVRMSVYLLVIARPGAMARSDWVVREVELSLAAGRTPIVVDIDEAFERTVGDTQEERGRLHRMRELLADRLRVPQRSGSVPPSIYDGPASDTLVQAVKRAFRATRQDVRRTRYFAAATVLFALISALAVAFAIQSARSRDEAQREAARARAGELAAQAQLVMTPTPQLGSLLAVAAAEPVLARVDTEIVPARQALMDATLRLGGRGIVHDARVRSVAISPDGTWLATSASDDRVRLWAIGAGDTASRLLSATELAAYPLAISPDGRWLAAGEGDTTTICHVSDGALSECERLSPESVYTHELVFDPSGQWLIGVGNDDDLWSWDLQAPHPARASRQIGRNLYTVRYAVFSADGRWLAARGLTVNDTWVWRIADGRIDLPRAVRPHGSRVDAIALDTPGARLAIGYEDGSVVVVPLDRHAGVQRLVAPPGDHSIDELAFSHDGRWLAARMLPLRDDGSRRNAVLLWRSADSGRFGRPEVLRHDVQTRSIAFHPRDRWLYVESTQGPVSLWDLTSSSTPRPAIQLRGHDQSVVSFDFDAAGALLVTGGVDGRAYVWDLSCKDVGRSGMLLRGHEAGLTQVAITRDARTTVTLSDDGTVRTWDLTRPSAGDPYVLLRACHSDITTAVLSGNGAQLAAGTAGGDVHVWDLSARDPVRSRVVLREASDAADPIEGLTFDGTGERLAAWTDGGVLTVWTGLGSTTRPQPIELPGHRARTSIISAAFGAAGTFASADFAGNAWLWQLADDGTAPSKVALSAPGRTITDVVVSGDGRWLAGEAYDTVWLWEITRIDEGTAPIALDHGESVISHVSFSPDSRFLWSVDQGGQGRVWVLPLDSSVPDRILDRLDNGPRPFARGGAGRHVFLWGDGEPRLLSATGLPSAWTDTPLQGAPSSRAGALSLDERLVASASGNVVSLWRTSAPGDVRSVLRANEYVDEIRFSKDERLLVFVAVSELFVSPIVDDRAIAPLRLHGHEGWCHFLELAAGDRWAVTQSWDAIRIWPLVTQELFESVKSRAGRDFRADERSAYLRQGPPAPTWFERLIATWP